MEHWYDRDRHELLSCSIFRVDEVQRESESGERGTFYVLEATDWVTVIPVVYDGEGRRCFVMVEQYRHGSGRVTMEFPAGTVDPGETAESTGRRELREETGYAAQSFELIGGLSPNPAFMANSTYTYVARGLRFEGEQQLDHHESIRPHLVPVDAVRSRMGTGAYDNAIMVASLALFDRWDRGRNDEK